MGVCKQNYVYDALSRLISDLLFQAIPLMLLLDGQRRNSGIV